MVKALIHYAEIGLKKGNFAFFEKKLIENIKKSSYKSGVKIKEIIRHEKRILANFDATEKKISDFLRNVFGIKYFSFVCEIDVCMEKLEKEVENKLKKFKKIKYKKLRSKQKDLTKTLV